MKRRNIIILSSTILIIIFTIIIISMNNQNEVNNGKTRIITSFYPIYIMTLNITEDINSVEVSNMAESHTGCIHDYTINTYDLKKFEDADIFIQNGQGIERFTDKILSSYPNIKTIEASKKITSKIMQNNEVNAHFWTSIDNYISQMESIAEELQTIDPINSDKYKENTLKYKLKLEILKSDFEKIATNLKNKKVVSLNESFSYLLKSIGMEEILIETDHEQNALSAEIISDVINQINNEKISCIIIEENDNIQSANTIKSETNAEIYKLKDCMSGDNSLDSYISDMKNNLEVLSKIK